MAGTIPRPSVSTTPVLLTGVLRGDLSSNQRDLLIQVKNTFVAKGWFVVQSYNANGVLPAPGVDTWATFADIKGSGGGGTGFSWIVLGNPWNAEQICWYATVSGGWLEIQTAVAPAGGFAGGTTGARPTAVPEINDNGIATYPEFLGTGPAGNTQFYATVWIADDGSYARVGWWYGGKLKSLWNYDQLLYGPDGWAKNFLLGMFHWGNTDYTVTGNRPTTDIMTKNWGSAGSFKLLATPSPDTSEQADGTLGSMNAGNGAVPTKAPVANPFSAQYVWIDGLGYETTGHGAAQNGFWGYSLDMWFTTPTFNDGDTMGDNFDFIIAGQLVLQWGLGAVGALLGGASTNYPTSAFYGRLSPCSCGPDDCNTVTTPLITLRNGAKELADKVNDASISDITWNTWINQGIDRLWVLVSTAFSDHYFKHVDFTLAGGEGDGLNAYDTTVLGDFRRVRFFERDPGTNARRKIPAFNFNEKDARTGSYTGVVWCNVRRYRLMGTRILVEPYEAAAGTYRLYYVPAPTVLEMTCDAIDAQLDEWAEFPMLYAAMKALGKEESDDGTIQRQMAAIREAIELAAPSRNEGDADVVADVEGDGRNGGAFWG